MTSSSNGRGHDRTTVVMGAGPGGLATGYWLAKHGASVTVVERAAVVGGLARTVERDGFKFDLGGHRWFSKVDEVNDFYKEVIADETVWVHRISRIYFDGKYIDYPLRVSNALAAIGPVAAAKAMLDYGQTRVSQRLDPKPIVSMEDAYVDQYGRTLYEFFFERYSEKVWGLPCGEMSGDWVSQRTKGMSLVTAVKDAIIPSNGAVQSLIDSFMYPRYGYGRLSERMAEGITASGNEVRLNAGVSKVLREGSTIKAVVVTDEQGNEETIEAAQFVSSIPLTVLCQIMEPPGPRRGDRGGEVAGLPQRHHRQPDARPREGDRRHLALCPRPRHPLRAAPRAEELERRYGPGPVEDLARRRVLLLLRRPYLEYERGGTGRADGEVPGRRPELHRPQRSARRLHRPLPARLPELHARVRSSRWRS